MTKLQNIKSCTYELPPYIITFLKSLQNYKCVTRRWKCHYNWNPIHFALKMQTMIQINVHYLFSIKCTCFMKLSSCDQPSILLSMHIRNIILIQWCSIIVFDLRCMASEKQLLFQHMNKKGIHS